MNLLKKGWYPNFIRLITLVYFRRVELYGKENIPARGPVLFIGLHKNGAVDGFVYYRTLAPVEFMLAAQLRRNPIVRLFFDGIEVTRAKDKGVHSNIAALKKCISFLEGGGRLFVFPEGTSTLGPTHLPFKEGAAILASRFDFSKGPLTVVPCGIFYDDPTRLGGKAAVVADKPLVLTAPLERREIQLQFTRALEAVGIDYPDAQHQHTTEQAAALLALYGEVPYCVFLRKLRDDASLYRQAETTLKQINQPGLWHYKGVAVFPRSVVNSLWTWCITAPFVCYAFLWNLLPVCAGYLGAQKGADDENVISLWKIIPSFTLGLILTLAELLWCPRLTVLSLAVSLLGFMVYGAWKKHTVSLYNWVRRPAEMKKFNGLRKELYEKAVHSHFAA